MDGVRRFESGLVHLFVGLVELEEGPGRELLPIRKPFTPCGS
jgi:hypothetical protein